MEDKMDIIMYPYNIFIGKNFSYENNTLRNFIPSGKWASVYRMYRVKLQMQPTHAYVI